MKNKEQFKSDLGAACASIRAKYGDAEIAGAFESLSKDCCAFDQDWPGVTKDVWRAADSLYRKYSDANDDADEFNRITIMFEYMEPKIFGRRGWADSLTGEQTQANRRRRSRDQANQAIGRRHNHGMKSKHEIAQAVVEAEAAYIEAVRKAAPVTPWRGLLERETHDALNKFLCCNKECVGDDCGRED